VRRTLMWFGMLALVGCAGEPEAAPVTAVARVRCVPVASEAWSSVRRLRGVTAAAPDRDAIVAPQVAGRLLRVPWREGDAVRAGHVVAEVEAGPLRDTLAHAEAVLAQARARHEAAVAAVAREAHLFERGIRARQALEAARSEQGQSEGAIAAARAEVDRAREELARAVVRAPIDGVVVHLFRRAGELVDGTPASPVLEIADPTSLELDASATVEDLVTVQAGQAAQVTFDALPDRVFSGRVRSVAPAVDAATGVGRIQVTIDTEDVRLPIGALGEVEVEVGAPRSVHVVPASAVRSAGGAKTELVLCHDGRAAPTEVTVGERRDGKVAIESGLEGLPDPVRVVEDGAAGLEEGTALEEES